MSGGTVADASHGNWVDTRVPPSWRPWLRLSRADRPIGGWLLMWPCWWSTALAAVSLGQPWPNPLHLLLFMIGAFVMRGAGCTVNDLVDRNIDKLVERTRSRPLPSGQVSVRGACLWLGLQAFIGLAVLLFFNRETVLLGIASLAIVAVYPFMKRITSWPQFVLGLAFSWGALMGWMASYGSLSWPPLLLYVGSILWTIGYDTIYACQDKDDDAIVGVLSTARLFGDRTVSMVGLFYTGTVILIGLAFAFAGVGFWSSAGLAAFAAHLAWQVRSLDIDDGARCLALFRSNRDAGALLFAGLALDCFF